MLLTLKKAIAKTYFLHYDIWVKTFHTTLHVLLHWHFSRYLRMVTQQIFLKKRKAVSKSAFKMKVISAQTLFELFLSSFCPKTRLCNIFKTTNAKAIIKAISESLNKLKKQHVFQAWKTTTFKQPMHFSEVVWFLATISLKIVITFLLLWQNQSNYIFQKLHLSLSKQTIIHIPLAT